VGGVSAAFLHVNRPGIFTTEVKSGCLGLCFFLGVLWIGWRFQPWMPMGRSVYISSEHLGDYDFQVWQQKTDIVEFSTGLFARRHGEPWRAYLLDWEDVYRSTIVLREREAGVEVFQDGKRIGVFDKTQRLPSGFERIILSTDGA
jgi:hypothetical protein